jgi:hypothetical protein
MFIAKKRDKSGNVLMNARLTPHFCPIHGPMTRLEAPHERASEDKAGCARRADNPARSSGRAARASARLATTDLPVKCIASALISEGLEFHAFTAMRLAAVDFPDMHKEIGGWNVLRQ